MNTAGTGARKILAASAAALLIAALLLVTVVLPAEYGWDPLGTGEALGVTDLAEATDSPLTKQGDVWRSDKITFQLAPFEAVEYKYRLSNGATLLFNWQADGELLYDMHAEPDGVAPGYAQSFSKNRANESSGSYTAPFGGIHGWFWQNRGQEDVSLTLETRGFYSEAIEMKDGREFEYVPEVHRVTSVKRSATGAAQGQP